MPVPFVIDNVSHRLADTLKELLAQSPGKPLDIVTAYFSISGYRLIQDGLHKLGAFRLLLGTDIGHLDVFALQDEVIEQILDAEQEVVAKAAAPTAVDPIQQTVTEQLKNSLRRRTIDREQTKACIAFLGQPMGRSLHVKLKEVSEDWVTTRDDPAWLGAIGALAEQFAKDRQTSQPARRLSRQELDLICYEFLTT